METFRTVGEGDDAARLLVLLSDFSRELGRKNPSLSLDASLLDRLGIDSLGRLELSLRIERAFRVTLPEEAVLRAETPRALIAAIESARGRPAAEVRGPRATEPPTPNRTEPGVPTEAINLVDVFEWYIERAPSRIHATLLGDGAPRDLTYGELARRARAVAAALGSRGIGPGETVGLMLPTGEDYLASFLGAQMMGAIPVPVYPPLGLDGVEDHLNRQGAILANAEVRALVAPRAAALAGRLLQGKVKTLAHLLNSEDLRDFATGNAAPPRFQPGSGDIAMLQYTSGSTSSPKGVVLTHANLLANIRAIGKAQRLSSRDVVVSWLPLYHDMGLIGAWLSSLYYGARAVILAPQAFLARPHRWLQAIHDYRGTGSTAPNFAYEICATKIADEDIAGLDLSSWTRALNGAEPVSRKTLERFTQRFAPHGFRADALTPVYGLAENCVAVTMPDKARLPRFDVVDRRRLQSDGVASPVAPGHAEALHVVACGHALEGHDVRVVDDGGAPCPDRVQGRVQFRGPSATSGYYRNPEATKRLLRDGWLETGDLGYLVEGELHITGRQKDLIIRGGRNLHPQEIEEVVGELEGVRKGCVAAFGCPEEGRGTERVVVVAETRRPKAEHETLEDRIRAALRPVLQGEPDEIVLIPPRTIPKTSSGKIRRGECKERYLKGTLSAAPSPWSARLRLAGSALRTHARAAFQTAGAWLYAAHFFVVLHTFMVVGWSLMMVTPGISRRRRVMRSMNRVAARLVGIKVNVTGLEFLRAGPCIAVANHQSYFDTVVMNSIVPLNFFFTPKRDLEREFVARSLMRALDYPFVDRLDPKTGVADLDAVKDRLRRGESAVVYPEGIFYAEPGLRHFYMGAFAVAAETGTKVVPVAIAGPRAIWRGERPFARHGSVTVTIGSPIAPRGSSWEESVRLRNEARNFIAAHCGEPDITG